MSRAFEGVSVLFGAGVGVPAGLPTAPQLIEAIADEFVLDRGWRKKIAAACQPWGPLRFEAAMEWLSETADGALEVLRLFDDATPGPMHVALAQAGVAGARLVTTNFDDLVERAIGELGEVAQTVDAQDPEAPPPVAGVIAVIKLHGARRVHGPGPVGPSDRPPHATISEIVKSGAGFGLSQPAERLLKETVDGAELLVIGYSGSDDLDVVPSLEQCRPRRVTWVHHGDGEPTPATIADAGLTDGARQLLDAWEKDGVKVRLLVGETARALAGRGLDPDVEFDRAAQQRAWRAYVARWSAEAHAQDPTGLGWVALCMGALGRDADKARAVAESTPSPQADGLWRAQKRLYELAQSAYHLERPLDETLDMCVQAVDAAARARDFEYVANSEILTARRLMLEDRFDDARAALDRAEVALERDGYDNTYGHAYLAVWRARLGLREYDADVADEHAREAAERFRALGSWSDESEALQIVGQAAWLDGEYERAVEPLDRAIAIARKGRFPEELKTGLMRRAEVAYFMGDVATCYRCGRESANVALDDGLTSELGESMAPWGRAANELGRFDEAEQAFRRAMADEQTMSSRSWRCDAVLGLADTLLNLGRPDDAVEVLDCEQATVEENPWDAAHAAAIRARAGVITVEDADAAIADALAAAPLPWARPALCIVRLGLEGAASDELRAMVEGIVENNPHPDRRDLVRGWLASTR